MKVKEIMNKEVITCDPEDTILTVVEKFKMHKISGMPVIKLGKVVGIISERDILAMITFKFSEEPELLLKLLDVVRHSLHDHVNWNYLKNMINNDFNKPVHSIMTKEVYTISMEKHIDEAEELMSKYKVNRLPVIEKDGTLVGILTRGDIIVRCGMLKGRAWDVEEIVKDYQTICKRK